LRDGETRYPLSPTRVLRRLNFCDFVNQFVLQVRRLRFNVGDDCFLISLRFGDDSLDVVLRESDNLFFNSRGFRD
jgi:hypothetical protein